jgi:hypothetical protein
MLVHYTKCQCTIKIFVPYTSNIYVIDKHIYKDEHLLTVWPGKNPTVIGSSSVLEFLIKQSMEARNRVGTGISYRPARAGILKRLRSSGINSKESIPQAFVAWRAGTITLFLLRLYRLAKLIPWNPFPGPLKV